jgi:hypothetical protein
MDKGTLDGFVTKKANTSTKKRKAEPGAEEVQTPVSKKVISIFM